MEEQWATSNRLGAGFSGYELTPELVKHRLFILKSNGGQGPPIRVRLKKTSRFYGQSLVTGTIRGINKYGIYPLRVRWDDGGEYAYKYDDLEIVYE